MPLIPFPDIPDLPGVPALPRSPNFPPTVAAVSGLLQGIIWRVLQVETQWGIFNSDGEPLGDPENFVGLVGNALEAAGIGATLSVGSVEYSKETKVSDFPIEKGKFASFNKVETPATPTVTLVMAGKESDRRSFLDAIDTACKSTDLYSVVTPEVVYVEYSVERYNYQRRSSKGATLLIVEISLKEIRQVSATFAQTEQIDDPQDVGATPQADNGKVQAKEPKVSTALSLARKTGLVN